MSAPGDLDRAFDDLERAIEIQPDLATAYANRGNAYLQRGLDGDLERAQGEFNRAIELDPDSPMAFFNRGLVSLPLETWKGLLPTCDAPRNWTLWTIM